MGPNGDWIEIACTLRQEKRSAIAVWTGTTETYRDPRTGEEFEREVWRWLPRSVSHYDKRTGKLWLPLWLAIKEGMK